MGKPANESEFRRIVEDYYAQLYRYAYRLSGTQADAEDLTQETFCKAHLQWGKLRETTKVRSWLYTILRNVYLHKLRSAKIRKEVTLESFGTTGSGELPATMPDIPEELEVSPEKLQAALNELPEEFRTPVILFYFEEMTYRDIAEQMELPIGTVMSRLARAKTHLKARLVPQ
ncbi:MAG: RNA polymerase sigma factor [Zavarzinella sp.]